MKEGARRGTPKQPKVLGEEPPNKRSANTYGDLSEGEFLKNFRPSEDVTSEDVTGEGVSGMASKEKAAVVVEEPKVFAIVRTAGKQYKVSPGTKISIDTVEGNPGDKITFSDVLMAGKTGGSEVKILTADGSSLGVTVTGRLVAHKRDKKVIIFKKRLKGGYTKKQGHRQDKSEIVIESVSL
jgi:ribosomal protein L21